MASATEPRFQEANRQSQGAAEVLRCGGGQLQPHGEAGAAQAANHADGPLESALAQVERRAVPAPAQPQAGEAALLPLSSGEEDADDNGQRVERSQLVSACVLIKPQWNINNNLVAEQPVFLKALKPRDTALLCLSDSRPSSLRKWRKVVSRGLRALRNTAAPRRGCC